MSEKSMTLTEKIDALREKGFSDEEINQLLSSPEKKESPFNIGDIFNNGASAEEWNQQVDETEKLYINTEAFSVLFIGMAMISVILLVRGFIEFHIAVSIFIMCIVLVFLIQVFSAPKYREKIKFFVKKR